jgi:hypothetical protein
MITSAEFVVDNINGTQQQQQMTAIKLGAESIGWISLKN